MDKYIKYIKYKRLDIQYIKNEPAETPKLCFCYLNSNYGLICCFSNRGEKISMETISRKLNLDC